MNSLLFLKLFHLFFPRFLSLGPCATHSEVQEIVGYVCRYIHMHVEEEQQLEIESSG